MTRGRWGIVIGVVAGLIVLGIVIAIIVILMDDDEDEAGEDFASTMDAAEDDLDEHWERKLEAEDFGSRYDRPEIEYYDDEVQSTDCGDTVANNAFYCPSDNTIYLHRPFLQQAFDESGPFSPVLILAHEWGHAVQRGLEILNDTLAPIEMELQADCLAGVYAFDADDRDLYTDSNLLEAGTAFIEDGDPEASPWWEADTHGTPAQRIDSYTAGYEEGFARCFTPPLPALNLIPDSEADETVEPSPEPSEPTGEPTETPDTPTDTATEATQPPGQPTQTPDDATGTPTATATIDIGDFEATMDAAAQDLDDYWQQTLEEEDAGSQYETPEVVYYNDEVEETDCGETTPNNAFYCPADNTIYLHRPFVEGAFDEDGAFSPIFVLAHEWAHAAQQDLGILSDPPFSVEMELQADCLAGAYAADVDERDLIPGEDLLERGVTLIENAKGDQSPWWSPTEHGTTEQRVDNYTAGYEEGFAACFIAPLPTATPGEAEDS